MSSEPDLVRTVLPGTDPELAARREWLVTNGLGGYASGTIGGIPSRRYHGYLIAALPNPAGRVLALASLAETLRLPDRTRADLGWVAPQFTAGRHLKLAGFALEMGLPVWTFKGDGITVEKRLALAYGHNTTVVQYRLLEGGPCKLELRPSLQFRGHDDFVNVAVPDAYALYAVGTRIEMIAPTGMPNLRFRIVGPHVTFVVEPKEVTDFQFLTEEHRGYASRGRLYSPGRFRCGLVPGETVSFLASTHSWETLMSVSGDEMMAAERARRRRLLDAASPTARTGLAAELVLAADAFVIRPAGRQEDHIRARIAGDEAWTVIAGYHWFTDWGRDTMISLEGLTLCTGRAEQAGSILRMFGHHIKDGLVPNMFPEGANDGLYHTADASLWFFHAISRYVHASHDARTLAELLPKLRLIIDAHVTGTKFGIGVDPADGLLRQGAPGYQLTWMDAKAGDWVVTPRRGKAVEINALWYNALCLMDAWHTNAGDLTAARRYRELADRCRASFATRFWNPATGHLFDVVDCEDGTDDPACRPNQVFAISLPHAVLDPAHWPAVLAIIETELLTPVGLRSLSPKHPDYKRTYHGDLLTRDAAYHQGTVWSWLIGPYIDARLRVHPEDTAGARAALAGLVGDLQDFGVGYIGEVFDAEPPFTPGGCIAQAWGVAELLRCLLRVSA